MHNTRAEGVADLILKTVLIKIKAMEDTDSGLLSKADVTRIDKLAVILGTFRNEYHDTILDTETNPNDISKVIEMIKRDGVEVGREEIITLAKIRRFIIDKISNNGISLFLEKTLNKDVEKYLHKKITVS